MDEKKILLKISDLKKYFPVKGSKGSFVKANDGISINIYEGETLGMVGESGCGKSTFGRVLLQLYKQTSGETIYYGRNIDSVAPKYAREDMEELKELPPVYKAHNEVYESACECNKISKILKNLQLAKDEKPNRQSDFDSKISIQKKLLSEREVTLKKHQEAAVQMMTAYADNETVQKFKAGHDGGIDLARLTYNEMRHLRRDLQIIFQDPYSSLNPRMTVGQIIGEGLKAHSFFKSDGSKIQEYITKVMDDCGLAPYMIHRYPHQFSGGQRQRIGIARALAVQPKFVVCDEAVSALDVSIQSQILNLLQDLKERDNLTYLFISHDLSVVKYISDRIGVMYLGTMVELASTKDIFANPRHPYTEALLSAIPTTDVDSKKETILLEGDIPSPVNPPPGCKFHTRCRYATDVCRQLVPELKEVAPEHFAACHVRNKAT